MEFGEFFKVQNFPTLKVTAIFDEKYHTWRLQNLYLQKVKTS